jgi:hypothetical protein
MSKLWVYWRKKHILWPKYKQLARSYQWTGKGCRRRDYKIGLSQPTVLVTVVNGRGMDSLEDKVSNHIQPHLIEEPKIKQAKSMHSKNRSVAGNNLSVL